MYYLILEFRVITKDCTSVADWLSHLVEARAAGLEVRQMDLRNSYGFVAEGVRYSLSYQASRDMYTWFDTQAEQAEILDSLEISLGMLVDIFANYLDRTAWFESMGAHMS